MYRSSKAIYSSSIIDSPSPLLLIQSPLQLLQSPLQLLYNSSRDLLDNFSSANYSSPRAIYSSLEFLSSYVQVFWRPLQLFQSHLASTRTAHLDSRALYCTAPLEPSAFTDPLLLLHLLLLLEPSTTPLQLLQSPLLQLLIEPSTSLQLLHKTVNYPGKCQFEFKTLFFNLFYFKNLFKNNRIKTH